MRLAICILVACVTTTDLRGEPPNIVFIFSDDHAVRSVGAYGSRLLQTPNLDRISQEGALFRNSFVGNSICAPSRATVLTGQHSHVNGQRTNLDSFDPTRVTFPKLLRKAGYQTALVGKWHLRSEPTGFDSWEVLAGQGHYYNPVLRTAAGEIHYQGYSTDIITDRSLDWLESRDRAKPFLLMCQFKSTHRTWAPAPRHLDLFADRDLPEPSTLFDDYAGRSPALRENEMSIAEHFYWDYDLKIRDSGLRNPFDRALKSPEYRRMTAEQKASWDAAYEPRNAKFLEARPQGRDLVRWKYQRYIKDYLRCVTAIDENVGRVLAYLDEHGLAENTIVVYASDQGFYLGEHGWYDKRWMFEESLRTPLLVRWPERVEAGRTVDALVQNIDYAPTFLDAAGVEIPRDMQGRSLLPLLSSDPPDSRSWREAIYYAYYEKGEHNVPRHDGIRTDRHKLMYFPDTREWQLFDLEKDPHELQSLHEDPAEGTTFFYLRMLMSRTRELYGASLWHLPGESRRIFHDQRELEGWTVHVARNLLAGRGRTTGEAALRILGHELFEITQVVPAEPLGRLREVPIWLDLDHSLETMQYHPSRRWLEENGHDPAMEKGVHIPQAKRLIRLQRENTQPWVILHELAHAYHDRVLGFDEATIRAAFEASRDAGIYDSVLHISGKETRHYALTDHKEFFAELTEAYFGTNDFYPFVRAELKRHDPGAYELLERVWGSR